MPWVEADAVLTFDDAGELRILAPGRVVWRGERVVEVEAAQAPLPAAEEAEPGWRLPGHVVLPGLLNGHNHAAMALMRGLADDSALFPWLSRHIWPLEAKLTADDIYIGTLLACAEMIRTGTVGYADMYFEVEAVARATAQAGLRGWIARGLIGRDDPDYRRLEAAIEQGRRIAALPGIVPMLGPHAPYTCPPAYLQRVAEWADRLGWGIHIHLSESAQEVADVVAATGLTPIGLAAQTGLLSRPTLIAHGVHIQPEDVPLLQGRPAGVIACPVSNAKLGNGIMPWRLLRRGTVPIGLGTDGPASTNTLDLFTEMKAMAWLQKLREGDPEVFGARDALFLATAGSAAVLHHDGGRLYPGGPADWIAVRTRESWWTPRHDWASNLVYAATGADVAYTMVRGRLLMAEGRILAFDEATVREEAQARAQSLLAR